MKITNKDLKQIKDFQEEKDLFYVLSLIAQSPESLIISDLNNYLIARNSIGLPTWIWTKDDINDEKILELKNNLELFLEKGENKFTCKKELYNILKEEYDTSNYFEMCFLSCDEPINPEKGKGIFVRPNYADKVTIAEYLRANNKEMYKKQTTQKEALEEVEDWLEKKKFYVLKDSTGEIVSMAGFGVVEDMAKITHVYTPIEERGKGYCQYLIYSLSKKLLEDNLKPVLYSDYNYKASNKAYKKVGFVEKDILINFNINR